jgi:hypothetical protein
MRLFAVALVFASSSVYASDVSQLLQQCRQISNADSRLSCYDQVANALQPVTASPSTPTLPAATTVTTVSGTTTTTTTTVAASTAAPASVEVEFGKRLPRAVDEVESISSTIVQVRYNLQKKAIIQLANGQSWQQAENVQMNLPTGKTCTVKRAALGSFLFSCEGSSKSMRVKRLE